MVYDVTNRSSFDECDNWMAEATKYGANCSEVPWSFARIKLIRKEEW